MSTSERERQPAPDQNAMWFKALLAKDSASVILAAALLVLVGVAVIAVALCRYPDRKELVVAYIATLAAGVVLCLLGLAAIRRDVLGTHQSVMNELAQQLARMEGWNGQPRIDVKASAEHDRADPAN